MNSMSGTPGDRWSFDQIQDDSDVLDANGDKVGSLDELHPNYLTVSKGFIFTSERYIPLSAIDRVEGDKIYLNVTKDDIDDRNWDQIPAEDVYERTDQPVATAGRTDVDTDYDVGTDTGTDTDTERMKLREERLRADKERVQAGQVDVGKDVVTEQRSMDVPISHEEVTVEHHPVDPTQPASGDIGEGEDREIHIPVHEEQVRADTEPVVYDEVDVHKRRVQDTQRVSGTVRREEARVDKEGDVEVDAADQDRESEPPPPPGS